MLGHPNGDSRLLSGFWPLNLPVCAWRATGDISTEVFFMSEPSAWRSLVEMATSIQGLMMMMMMMMSLGMQHTSP